jgi:predicted porin
MDRKGLSEDWLSLIIGLVIFGLALGLVADKDILGWVVTTGVWTDLGKALAPVSKAYANLGGIGSLIATYARGADGEGSSTELVGGIRAGSDTGAWHGTVGYEYPFSRRTRVQVFTSRLSNETRAAYEFGSNSPGRITGGRATVVSFGMRHDF